MKRKEIVDRLKKQFGMGAEDYYKWLISRATEAEQLEIENARLRKALEEIAHHVNTPLREKEDYEKTSYLFIDIAKRGLGY